MHQSGTGLPLDAATSNGAVAAALLRRNRRMFRAVVRTVVPQAEGLTADAWEEVEAIVGRALVSRPPTLLKQLDLFLRVLDVVARVRRFRRFERLSLRSRTRLLDALEKSPVLLLRRGFWGLRTLALMGYYARQDAKREIGYRADPHGWEARTA